MGITIGIDVGGSTTKIVGIAEARIKTPMQVKADDPVASVYGAFGKFIDSNTFSLQYVDRILVTGVGSSFIDRPIYGLPTFIVEEFLSNGLGGLYLSSLEKAIIVSMGTGTALVRADGGKIVHIGGTGIGGGTIIGLSSKMINLRTIDHIIAAAEKGDLNNVDLMVSDLTQSDLPNLLPGATASNFGKTSDVATSGDIALGILNLVFQSIGTTAIFAVKDGDINDVVLIGNLTSIPQCHTIFSILKNMFGVNFIIPENSEYGTAVGAALAYLGGSSVRL